MTEEDALFAARRILRENAWEFNKFDEK